jgi:hypothetical protein
MHSLLVLHHGITVFVIVVYCFHLSYALPFLRHDESFQQKLFELQLVLYSHNQTYMVGSDVGGVSGYATPYVAVPSVTLTQCKTNCNTGIKSLGVVYYSKLFAM